MKENISRLTPVRSFDLIAWRRMLEVITRSATSVNGVVPPTWMTSP